ncbi:MAG TPA: T9SS type A sorting domain-containing protein [Chlorobiota bacterium]|nr:T9SS type A sorting domain-containing protein [Chlorobiota bacterium]
MIRSLLRCFVIVVAMSLSFVSSVAQSNPTAYSLSLGTYTLNSWDASSSAGTYPANMVFQQVASIDADLTSVPTVDWNCAYNLSSGARINGDGANGFSFINTGSTPCNTAFAGAAVLAINTTGRTSVQVSWTGRTVATGSRLYAVRLLYRIGTSGSWNDVAGTPVEYQANATSGHNASFTTTLPSAAENQSNVQLMWRYYQYSTAVSGARPRLGVDDISVSSAASGGVPTKLAITQITPASPSTAAPFSIQVRSVDNSNIPQNVAAATSFSLSLVSGSGTLGGTLVGTIPAGQSVVTVSGVTYNVAQSGVVVRASRTSGDLLAFGDSNPFTVLQGATGFNVLDVQNVGWANSPFPTFRALATRPDGTTDSFYDQVVTITKVSGPGNVVFTSSVTPVAGVATFDNVSVDAPGTYVLRVNGPGLTSYTLPTITVFATPVLTTNLVPQYVSSRVSTSLAFALPQFALVTFTNLQPSTTYRFNTGWSTDQILTSTGPGLNYHFNRDAYTYAFDIGKTITGLNTFSQFSTGPGETSKTVWVNYLASTNAVFSEGNTVYWRVVLGDNLGRRIRYYELANTSTVIRLGTGANQATGITDVESQSTPKNIICLYDNVAGTGRPLSSALVQDDGSFLTAPQIETIYANVENADGGWATLIPNTLPTGVRRIEERDGRTGAIVYAITSPDGVWNGVSTVNPSGGFSSPIYLETPRITIQSPLRADTVCAQNALTVRFTARGMQNVRVEYSLSDGLTWELIDVVPASQGTAVWNISDLQYNDRVRIRVTGIERPDVSAITQRFVIVAPLALAQQPQSQNICLGDDTQLLVIASGTVRRYQWFKDGVALPGTDAPILRIEDAQFSTSGRYWCEVYGFGGCGDLRSEDVVVRVARPTQIVQSSRAIAARLGDRAVLWVEAEVPNEALSYQWYRGENPLRESDRIRGVNSSRLEILSVEAGDIGGGYTCVVVGVCGTATSRAMRLFTTGVYVEFASSSANVCVGANATLIADVYANPSGAALSRQWFRNGLPLVEGAKYSGTMADTLVIRNVDNADLGVYTLRAELTADASQYGESDITVAAASAPVITTQPQSVSVCEGETATLSVGVQATGEVTYAWSKDGTVLPNETSATITFVGTSARGGSYSVVVSTACGSVTSAVASVTIDPATQFTQNLPPTTNVTLGQTLTLTVAATGAGTLQYQWYKDGTELTGEVAPTFTKPNVVATDAGRYWVRIRTACGDTFSDTTTVATSLVSSVYDALLDVVTNTSLAPNPSSDAAEFSFDLLRTSHVTISLLDASGRQVVQVMDAELAAGPYVRTINTSMLASGMYVVVVNVDGRRALRPLSVIK